MTAELIGQLAFVVFALIALGWIYWLVARVQLVLDRAEQAVDTADRLVGIAIWQPESDGPWRTEHEQRDVPEVVALDEPGIPVHVVTVHAAPDPDPATNPMPVVRTDTADIDAVIDTDIDRIYREAMAAIADGGRR